MGLSVGPRKGMVEGNEIVLLKCQKAVCETAHLITGHEEKQKGSLWHNCIDF